MKTGERVITAILKAGYECGRYEDHEDMAEIIERESGCNELAAVLEGGEEL